MNHTPTSHNASKGTVDASLVSCLHPAPSDDSDDDSCPSLSERSVVGSDTVEQVGLCLPKFHAVREIAPFEIARFGASVHFNGGAPCQSNMKELVKNPGKTEHLRPGDSSSPIPGVVPVVFYMDRTIIDKTYTNHFNSQN